MIVAKLLITRNDSSFQLHSDNTGLETQKKKKKILVRIQNLCNNPPGLGFV